MSRQSQNNTLSLSSPVSGALAKERIADSFDSLPPLGFLLSDPPVAKAGSWQEIRLSYTVGVAGLAEGGSLKIVFPCYSDWADFQTVDSAGENYVSAELASREGFSAGVEATPQASAMHCDANDNERPLEKTILVTVLDRLLSPGDTIHLRLGDRRFGGRGTRIQTFAEERFLWRAFVDVTGRTRYAEIEGAVLTITAGPPSVLRIITPSSAQTGAIVPLQVRAEDIWGNVSEGVTQWACFEVCDPAGKTAVSYFEWTNEPWAVFRASLHLGISGPYQLRPRLGSGSQVTEALILSQEIGQETRAQPAGLIHECHPGSGANSPTSYLT